MKLIPQSQNVTAPSTFYPVFARYRRNSASPLSAKWFTLLLLPAVILTASSRSIAAPIATLTGHSDAVTAVAFSPNGKVVAAASRDKTVLLWDIHSQELVNTLQHTDSVLSLAFSSDGGALATGGGSLQEPRGSAKLWDMRTGRLAATLDGVAGAVTSLAFSPDGTTIAVGSRDGAVRIWNPATDKVQTALDGQGIIMAVAFSGDGAALAAGTGGPGSTRSSEVWLWKLAGGNTSATSVGLANAITAADFSVDGSTLAVGTTSGAVRLWSTARSKPVGGVQILPSPIVGLGVSGDGKMVAAGGEEGARVWNVDDGQVRSGYDGGAAAVAFSAGGRLLATGGQDKNLRLWSVR